MTRNEQKLRKVLTTDQLALCEFNGAREVELDDSQLEGSELRQLVGDTLGYGGFSTGWGGFVFRKDYKADGDWNDRTSRCHY